MYKHQFIIFYADFNLDLTDKKNENIAKIIKKDFNLITPNRPTRKGFKGQKNTYIDYFLTSIPT